MRSVEGGEDVQCLALQEKVKTGNVSDSPLWLNFICHHIWTRGDDTLLERLIIGNCRYLSALCLPVILIAVQPNPVTPSLPARSTINTEKHYRIYPLDIQKNALLVDINVWISRVCS